MSSHPILSDLESDSSLAVAQAFVAVVARYFAETRGGSGRVSTPLTADDLARRFGEPLPRGPQDIEAVLARLERDVLPDCNRLTHPRSMGHQVSAPLPVAVWTEALTAAVNQSGAVWEMSPVGTVIEAQVVRWMCALAGFGPDAGGTFTSGGTEATFAGLLAARQAAVPDAWKKGVGANPPVVVCGEHAHYGVARAIGELGLGTDNACVIPSKAFKMDVDALGRELDRLSREGRLVMAVVATAGTTATGSFDDLESIGRLCEERDVWLHVDGAHGASALLSPTHGHRLAGVQRARSIAWDPHKMMLMPLTASVVLVRDEARPRGGVQPAGAVPVPRGRRLAKLGPGAAQLHLLAAHRRVQGVGGTAAARRRRPRGALRPSLLQRPPDARGRRRAPGVRGDSRARVEHPLLPLRRSARHVAEDRLDALNLRMREDYNRSGTGWITTTMLGGRRVLRVTLMNPRTTAADLERTLADLAEIGKQLRSVRRSPSGMA